MVVMTGDTAVEGSMGVPRVREAASLSSTGVGNVERGLGKEDMRCGGMGIGKVVIVGNRVVLPSKIKRNIYLI